MNIREELQEAIAPWGLLDHPFYQAWNEGTLPVAALTTYAAEYGSFIAGIDAGWERVGEDAHAQEERQHAELWQRFAATLGTTISEPKVPEVKALNDTARRLFAEPNSAWGALYAFEAQQPETAATKLTGLDRHYPIDDAGRVYFEVHADDPYEADLIEKELADVDAAAADEAIASCAEMAKALWDSLTGIYEPHRS